MSSKHQVYRALANGRKVTHAFGSHRGGTLPPVYGSLLGVENANPGTPLQHPLYGIARPWAGIEPGGTPGRTLTVQPGIGGGGFKVSFNVGLYNTVGFFASTAGILWSFYLRVNGVVPDASRISCVAEMPPVVGETRHASFEGIIGLEDGDVCEVVFEPENGVDVNINFNNANQFTLESLEVFADLSIVTS